MKSPVRAARSRSGRTAGRTGPASQELFSKEKYNVAIDKVAVLGCGLMGSGIAQVCAQAGREVTVIEVAEEFLNKGLGAIKKQLDKAVEKGKMDSQSRDALLGRLHGSTRLEDAAGADLVVEAIIENMDEKHKTY